MAISESTQRMLFARSGGFCANPTCRADLFPDVHPETVTSITELAHIIPQSDAGPRGRAEVPASERHAYENILLLCPSCHSLVDKMKLQDVYNEELLKAWKDDQERRIREATEVPKLESRDDLLQRVRELMRENRQWWETYGPDSPAADDPLSEAPSRWLEEVRRVLIPNNWQIFRLLERNAEFLSEDEQRVAVAFKVHAEAFAQKHLSGEADPYAPRFPREMDDIFGP